MPIFFLLHISLRNNFVLIPLITITFYSYLSMSIAFTSEKKIHSNLLRWLQIILKYKHGKGIFLIAKCSSYSLKYLIKY